MLRVTMLLVVVLHHLYILAVLKHRMLKEKYVVFIQIHIFV